MASGLRNAFDSFKTKVQESKAKAKAAADEKANTDSSAPQYSPNSTDTYNSQLMGNPLSYYTLINARRKYIRAGTRNGGAFNYYDNPTRLYFKIMFYFWNQDSDSGQTYTGLLAPSWLLFSKQTTKTETKASTSPAATAEKNEANVVRDLGDNAIKRINQDKLATIPVVKTNISTLATKSGNRDGASASNDSQNNAQNNTQGTGDNPTPTPADDDPNKDKKATEDTGYVASEDLVEYGRTENFVDKKYWVYNSAWGYLMNNNEIERASMLEQFITLLSNISSEAPWYFQEVSGLADALKRDINAPFKAERKRIKIKCLKDAVDNRIGTLMDLYRAIVYSWQRKCEVVPANLRKFDMGIYVFSAPIKPLHHNPTSAEETNQYASLGYGDAYRTSYKYLEFHNCEFDFNSATTGLETLKNNDGTEPEYTIDIEFDDCYEQRYNEFSQKFIGDFVEWDVLETDSDLGGFTKQLYNTGSIDDKSKQDEYEQAHMGVDMSVVNMIALNNLSDKYVQAKYNKMHTDYQAHQLIKDNKTAAWMRNAGNEIKGAVNRYINTTLTRAIMGNTNTFSIPKIAAQLAGINAGRILESADAVKSYTEKNSRKTLSFSGLGKNKKVHKDFGYRGESLGNLYKARTVINNI